MGIGEKQPHVREPLHGRSQDLLGVGILSEKLIGGTVAHAHVIGHEQDDVGTVWELSADQERKSREQPKILHLRIVVGGWDCLQVDCLPD